MNLELKNRNSNRTHSFSNLKKRTGLIIITNMIVNPNQKQHEMKGSVNHEKTMAEQSFSSPIWDYIVG